ncbi:MAG: D-2-hydroxyacid dehydrogenase [Nitratireductor sp.]|nr:D-2-hydroxyacid dehydrogenase [Nitratireductor sp.]
MDRLPKIILHNDVTGHLASKLETHLPGADYRECNSYEGLPELVASYRPDIVYTVRFNGAAGYPRDTLFGPAGPKWIANGGVGTDHFGMWDANRVTVTNTAGVAADMMAEYVLGSFLHFTLDVPGLQADKAACKWNLRQMISLKGKTLLIVGLGSIGRAIAVRAKAFGMEVLGTRARPEPMEHVDEVHPAGNLQGLVPRADFIAVCTPLTSQTRGLIDRTVLSSVKRGAILADVSRGGVIVQADLMEALDSSGLAAAALDVFETEPLPDDSALWRQPNVLISPHCSSVYEGWEAASFGMFLANLDRWINGVPLENIVDPMRGY